MAALQINSKKARNVIYNPKAHAENIVLMSGFREGIIIPPSNPRGDSGRPNQKVLKLSDSCSLKRSLTE